MHINVYLSFNGQCAEAFKFYQSVLGGELVTFPFSAAPEGSGPPVDPAHADWLMHASLTAGEACLMGADCPPAYGPANPSGFCISLHPEDADKAQSLWAGLTEGARAIQMPLAPTFWSPMFGMFIDRFGQPWMINVPGEPS